MSAERVPPGLLLVAAHHDDGELDALCSSVLQSGSGSRRAASDVDGSLAGVR